MSRAGRPRRVGLREPNGQIQRSRAFVSDVHAIYVIECDNHVKVGRAKRPGMRLDAIQTGNPHPTSIAAVFPVAAKDAPALERAAQRLLKDSGVHVRGEWFRASSGFASRAIMRAATDMGIKIEALEPALPDAGRLWIRNHHLKEAQLG